MTRELFERCRDRKRIVVSGALNERRQHDALLVEARKCACKECVILGDRMGAEVDVDEDLSANDGKSFTFTAPDSPGEYKIYCDIPGHESAGMVATLIVEE